MKRVKRYLRKLLCKINLHRWTKWSDDGLTYIDYESNGECFEFKYKQVLKRSCKRCKLLEERRINLS